MNFSDLKMFPVKVTDTQRTMFKLNEWEGFWTKEIRAKKTSLWDVLY